MNAVAAPPGVTGSFVGVAASGAVVDVQADGFECVPPWWGSDAAPQKNLKPKRTIATKTKTTAIRPPTAQKPFGLPLSGIPATFIPQMLAISVAGRNIVENIVSM